MKMKSYIWPYLLGLCCLPALMLASCSDGDMPETGIQEVPEGMVEIQPVLPGMYGFIPRDPADNVRSAASRVYHTQDETNTALNENPVIRLPEGSTVWLIAESVPAEGAERSTVKKLVKNSYIVYNSEAAGKSYLVPCDVDDKGKMTSMEGKPMYLKEGESFKFYAVSPARKLDDTLFEQGKVGFQFMNGEYFYANDCRYTATTPQTIAVGGTGPEAVHEVQLNPMINQTAQLKFRITKGHGVHDLDIQPSGIQISGLQTDTPDGISWRMSQATNDEPIILQHGDKKGQRNFHNYIIDADENISIEVPIVPMYSISNPVTVVFHLKINGVPSSYMMMLNEKDFEAGYSYGYRGSVSIKDGIDVISWQFVEWMVDVEFPISAAPIGR